MISQLDLIAAIAAELKRQGQAIECGRHFNAIIKAADELIEELERHPEMASEGMGIVAWLRSDDVGLSSAYMASILGEFVRPYAHPRDVDDFGRCQRLLVAVPEFRDRLHNMKGCSKQWCMLIHSWKKIEELIASGEITKANRAIRECVK